MEDNGFLAFISRHEPTPRQHELAESKGFKLVHVGDADAFAVSVGFVDGAAVAHDTPFTGAVVVHPAAAMRLAPHMVIGVFENANRSPVGEPPKFEAVELHLYSFVDQ